MLNINLYFVSRNLENFNYSQKQSKDAHVAMRGSCLFGCKGILEPREVNKDLVPRFFYCLKQHKSNGRDTHGQYNIAKVGKRPFHCVAWQANRL
jgi:hypothetical protein